LSAWLESSRSFLVPILAIFTAFVLGGVIIWATTGDIMKVIGERGAFAGLWNGAFGRPQYIADTLTKATPYIFAGLAVALAFKCGLFNIGAEGQFAVGAVTAAFVGYSLQGLPFPVHLLLSLLAGLAAGMAWGAIPGVLKAYRGAHEVIITIMLNYIALILVQYLLGGPMKDRSPTNPGLARTPLIADESRLPMLFQGTEWEMHSGIVLALLAAVAVYIFLTRTTWGFEIRTVGANPHAARYSGMSVARSTILAMGLSGLLAGAAGTMVVTGEVHRHELGFGSGYGFDSIAIALLGRTHPFGVVGAAFLFGALQSGAGAMQLNTQISGSIIAVVQGLVLLFVAADVIIIWLFRLRTKSVGRTLALGSAATLAQSPSAEVAVSDDDLSPADPTLPGTDVSSSYPATAPADEPATPAFTGNKEGDET
jgi:simple sugar transport system permease protein